MGASLHDLAVIGLVWTRPHHARPRLPSKQPHCPCSLNLDGAGRLGSALKAFAAPAPASYKGTY